MATMALDLFTAGAYDGINSTVTRLIAAKLWQAVVKGYGKDIFQTTYDSPDYNKLMQLQANVWQFSGAKNLAQLNQLSALLVDANGKIRSRKDFITEAVKVNNTFANVYLPVEYDTAIASATMASKWVDIQTNKKTFGFIQFDAVIDSQTSNICRPLEGIIVPVDSAFLDTYYPPNHWKCRTTVRQLTSAVPSPQTELDRVAYNLPLKPQFEVNLGKKGWIFSEKHAYFKELTKDALGEITIAYKQSVYARPLDEQYVSVYKSKNGGEVRKHLLVQPEPNDPEDDYYDLLENALPFANKGHKVELLPKIDETDRVSRAKVLYNHNHYSSNPDYRIDSVYMDLKRPRTYKKVGVRINEAGVSDCIAIIKLNDSIVINQPSVKRWFNNSLYNKNTIYFIKDGEITKYVKND